MSDKLFNVLFDRSGPPGRREETWHELFRNTYLSFDRRTLGLTRVCLGFMLLMDLIRRGVDWEAMFGDTGVLPTVTILSRPQAGGWSLLHGFSSPFELWMLFGVMFATFFCLLIGYKTKLAQILAVVWVFSLNGRVLLIENGGYVVHNLLALWTAFMPLGDRFSVDALLASMKRKREVGANDLNERRDLLEPFRLSPFVSLVGAAFCFQLAIIYYFNVIHKTGPAWSLRNATAVHFVMYVDRMVNPLPAFGREYIPFPLWQLLTRMVVASEFLIPFFIFTPLAQKWVRRFALVLVNFLHIGFGSTFVLGPFAWALCVFSTLFFTRADWEDTIRVMRREKRRRTVLYDPTSGAALLFARIVARLDRFGLVGFVEAKGKDRKPGIVVEREDGTQVTGHRALSEIIQAIPCCAHFGKIFLLPVVSGITDGLMARGRWSRFLGHPSTVAMRAHPVEATPEVPRRVFLGLVSVLFAAGFLGWMTYALFDATTYVGRAFVVLFTSGVLVFAHARWFGAREAAPELDMTKAIAGGILYAAVLGWLTLYGPRGVVAGVLVGGLIVLGGTWRDARIGYLRVATVAVLAASAATFGFLAYFVFTQATKTTGRVFVIALTSGIGLFFFSKWWKGTDVPREAEADTRLAWFWGTVREVVVVAFFFAAANQAVTELWATRKHWNNFISWLNSKDYIKKAAGTVAAQPDPLRYLAHKPRYLQGWFMFSPNPVTDDGTVIVDAITVDGRHVDPFWGEPPNFDLLHAKSFGYNQIWSDYFNRIHMGQNRAYRDAAIDYMRRLPERTGNPNDRLISGEVYWVRDMNPKWRTTESYAEARDLLWTFGETGGSKDPPKEPEKPGTKPPIQKLEDPEEGLPD